MPTYVNPSNAYLHLKFMNLDNELIER
jgi:hypothetical protein